MNPRDVLEALQKAGLPVVKVSRTKLSRNFPGKKYHWKISFTGSPTTDDEFLALHCKVAAVADKLLTTDNFTTRLIAP